jgi:glutaredoxin
MPQPEVILYRMKLPTHECPYGLRAKQMLEEAGMDFDDRLLTSREEVDAFKTERGLETTPLVMVDGEEIGGSEELAEFLQRQNA